MDILPHADDDRLPGAPGLRDGLARPGILLVDDDPFMLGVQAHMLRGMGYLRVATAGSAQAALALLHEAPQTADVVICDLNMPGMDGIEFLKILDAGAFSGSVILLSGEGARVMHTVQKLLGSGRLVVLGALEKPAARGALRALLDCWKPSQQPAPAACVAMFPPDELHTASREGQWVLHYQPKVNLKTGLLVGVEALVRWNHPVRGLVAPDRFIEQAEQCGAIDALTWWVLAESLAQQRRWQAGGLHVRMAVNISLANLREPGFALRVADMVRAAGVLPQDVTLEITESQLISTVRTSLENLVRLRLQRFGLSIDDFGTGHSSLAQLRDVPFTELKIDRGFVQGARYNQIIRPILEASVGIAKRLDMQSVAEGIETEDDWHLLRGIGCDIAQGYFVARPMEAGALPAWVEQWSGRRPALVA